MARGGLFGPHSTMRRNTWKSTWCHGSTRSQGRPECSSGQRYCPPSLGSGSISRRAGRPRRNSEAGLGPPGLELSPRGGHIPGGQPPSLPSLLCAKSLQSCLTLLQPPWTVAGQAPLSLGFSRQEYWSMLPCLPPGDLPDPRIKPGSLTSPA